MWSFGSLMSLMSRCTTLRCHQLVGGLLYAAARQTSRHQSSFSITFGDHVRRRNSPLGPVASTISPKTETLGPIGSRASSLETTCRERTDDGTLSLTAWTFRRQTIVLNDLRFASLCTRMAQLNSGRGRQLTCLRLSNQLASAFVAPTNPQAGVVPSRGWPSSGGRRCLFSAQQVPKFGRPTSSL
jgi:hypothetical protein